MNPSSPDRVREGHLAVALSPTIFFEPREVILLASVKPNRCIVGVGTARYSFQRQSIRPTAHRGCEQSIHLRILT